MKTIDVPTILTLTGPSCSGKSSLARAMVATGKYREGISTTTRAPRPGETNGVDYHYVTPQEFADIEASGSFIEVVTFAGKSYGMTANEVTMAAAQGKNTIMVIDQHGAMMVNHHAHAHGWKLVSAFLDVKQPLAIARFLERYRNEADQEKARESYVNRLAKVVTDERSWGDEFDFDVYLRHSLSAHDTKLQMAELDAAMELACVPDKRDLRVIKTYSESAINEAVSYFKDELTRLASVKERASACTLEF